MAARSANVTDMPGQDNDIAEAGSKQLTLIQAITQPLHQEMAHDEHVVVLGEDVGKRGGVFLATEGLYETYGDQRVIDTPLSEGAIIGAATGQARRGPRPVAEVQFAD